MKRLWAAVVLFVLVLLLSVGGVVTVSCITNRMERELTILEAQLSAGAFSQAEATRSDIEAHWRWESRLLGAFLIHSQLERATDYLQQLKVRIAHEEKSESETLCSQLRGVMAATRRGELPVWDNIL